MVHKRILLGASAMLFTSVAFGQIKINTKSIGAATKAVQAVTLSNEDVINYTKEYI